MLRVGITVTGSPGSGSTTLSNAIAEKFGWGQSYYAGGVVRWLFGKIQQDGLDAALALTPEEVMRAMELNQAPARPQSVHKYDEFPKQLDLMVDNVQQEMLEKKAYGVHEGRVAWWLAQDLHKKNRAENKLFIHIACVVNPKVGVQRQMNRPENIGKTFEQVHMETEDRLASERIRYYQLYDIADMFGDEHFNLVIDTTHLTADEVKQEVFRWLAGAYPRLLDQWNIKI